MTLNCSDVVVTEPTLTPEERSVCETQSVITAAIRRTSTDDPLSGEFRIGYDVESPLTRLDFGGDDQERRHVHLLVFDCRYYSYRFYSGWPSSFPSRSTISLRTCTSRMG